MCAPSRSRFAASIGASVFVISAYWAAVAMWRSTFAIFGRDQGIFQYVAWAMAHGERVYVDFREINGPLIHVLHAVFLRLGGGDEHVFRVLDVTLSSLVFLLVGALIPGIARRKGDGAEDATPLERAGWALATWAVLTSQYVTYGWWQTAQRESFYDLFLLASIAIQMHAQTPSSRTRIPRVWLFAIAGTLSALTWFGKPTCLLYSAVQGLVILIDGEAPQARKRSFIAFAVSCAAVLVVMVGFIALVGDVRAYVQIVFGEVPRIYRYVWSRSIAECYEIYGNAPQLTLAIATLVPAALLAALGWMPRRFWLVVSLLGCGLFVFFLQGKGFPYHLHPVTAGAHLVWLCVAAWSAERAVAAPEKVRRFALIGTAVAGVAIAARAWVEASGSESAKNRWDLAGATAEARATEAYVAHFPWGDFFAWDLRQAGTFLREHTAPSDRVQTYGMDPYLLFLAQRRSASPYIYSFELNVDAALEGGSGGKPNEKDRTWLVETAQRNERRMLEAVERDPPAAFALIDKSPFSYAPDAVTDFDRHCPSTAAFMRARYAPAARFGAVQIWLRNDAHATR